MNVNQWNVFCSQKLNHCTPFIPHYHLPTPCHFNGCNSETSSGRTVKLHTKV
jgi:hypothetical protein